MANPDLLSDTHAVERDDLLQTYEVRSLLDFLRGSSEEEYQAFSQTLGQNTVTGKLRTHFQVSPTGTLALQKQAGSSKLTASEPIRAKQDDSREIKVELKLAENNDETEPEDFDQLTPKHNSSFRRHLKNKEKLNQLEAEAKEFAAWRLEPSQQSPEIGEILCLVIAAANEEKKSVFLAWLKVQFPKFMPLVEPVLKLFSDFFIETLVPKADFLEYWRKNYSLFPEIIFSDQSLRNYLKTDSSQVAVARCIVFARENLSLFLKETVVSDLKSITAAWRIEKERKAKLMRTREIRGFFKARLSTPKNSADLDAYLKSQLSWLVGSAKAEARTLIALLADLFTKWDRVNPRILQTILADDSFPENITAASNSNFVFLNEALQVFLANVDDKMLSRFQELSVKWEITATYDQVITEEVRSFLIALCVEQVPAVEIDEKGEIKAGLPDIHKVIADQRGEGWLTETKAIAELQQLLKNKKLFPDFRRTVFSQVGNESKDESQAEFRTDVKLRPSKIILQRFFQMEPAVFHLLAQHQKDLQALAKIWWEHSEKEKDLKPSTNHKDALLAEVAETKNKEEAREEEAREQAKRTRTVSLRAYEQQTQKSKKSDATLASGAGKIKAPKPLVSPLLKNKVRKDAIEQKLEFLTDNLDKSRVEVEKVVKELSKLEGPVDDKNSPQAKALADHLQKYDEDLKPWFRLAETSSKITNRKTVVAQRRNALLASLRRAEIKRIASDLLNLSGSVDEKDSKRFLASEVELELKTYKTLLETQPAEPGDDKVTIATVTKLVDQRKAQLVTELMEAELQLLVQRQLLNYTDVSFREEILNQYVEEYGKRLEAERQEQKRPIETEELERQKLAKRIEILERVELELEQLLIQQLLNQPDDTLQRLNQHVEEYGRRLEAKREEQKRPISKIDLWEEKSDKREKLLKRLEEELDRLLIQQLLKLPNQFHRLRILNQHIEKYERRLKAEREHCKRPFEQGEPEQLRSAKRKTINERWGQVQKRQKQQLPSAKAKKGDAALSQLADLVGAEIPRKELSAERMFASEKHESSTNSSALGKEEIKQISAPKEGTAAPQEVRPQTGRGRSYANADLSQSLEAAIAAGKKVKHPSVFQRFLSFLASLFWCGRREPDDKDSVESAGHDEAQGMHNAVVQTKSEQKETSQAEAALAVGANNNPPIEIRQQSKKSNVAQTGDSAVPANPFLEYRHYYNPR